MEGANSAAYRYPNDPCGYNDPALVPERKIVVAEF
jgi:hypothetical protein